MDWRKNFNARKENLYKVGPHVMLESDMIGLGFDPTEFPREESLWAKPSNYDIEEIAKSLQEIKVKAQAKIVELQNRKL